VSLYVLDKVWNCWDVNLTFEFKFPTKNELPKNFYDNQPQQLVREKEFPFHLTLFKFGNIYLCLGKVEKG